MKRRINIVNKHSSTKTVVGSLEIPDTCPWCSTIISPVVESVTKYDTRFEQYNNLISLVLSCTSCHQHFMQTYNVRFNISGSIDSNSPVDEKPIPRSYFEYPHEIDNISEDFSNIINQSKQAEGMGLNHLAGIGFRKAIEFLVKDYLINHKEKDAEDISKNPLMQCIELLDDTRLKSLAKAATWIGNDETHYTRKHESRDIEDMKKFLHSITLFISYELSIEDAEDFTSNK